MTTVTGKITSEVKAQFKAGGKVQRMNPDTGRSAWALVVCKVVTINYEDMLVTLRTVVGTSQEFNRIPVPLTFPGCGARHFFGAMPQEGDFCVCGWMPQSSEGAGKTAGTKVPVILSWIPHGVQMGQGWMVTQPFTSDEYDMGSNKAAKAVKGTFQQVRHKLRHMQPGNIVCSSAQGSDLVLDEGVYLTNRRANEIRLRDQDQALVVRSLQQFHAMAGVRIYGGMAQRDATLLQPTMVSDGILYDGANQTHKTPSEPWDEFDLGQLTPARNLRRPALPDGTLGPAEFDVPDNIDPYVLLSRGLIIDKNGHVFLSPTGLAEDDAAYYGGKTYYRVPYVKNGAAADVGNAAVGGVRAKAFSEYRIEVSHTSDGTLPVTEQTEGFDADRLPQSANPQNSSAASSNVPLVEVAYGTVIGNDPFTTKGKKDYGFPLSASIFSASGDIQPSVGSSLGQPVKEQLASLFRLKPIESLGTRGAWWGVKKDGSFLADLTSMEINIAEGATIASTKPITFKGGGIAIEGSVGGGGENTGISLVSEAGTVKIHGGGQEGGATKQIDNMTSPDGGGGSPSVTISGPVIKLDGDKEVQVIAADSIRLNTPKDLKMEGGGVTEIKGGSRIVLQSDEIMLNSAGKIIMQYGGPKNGLPTNGASREQTITSTVPGVQDEYSLPVMGGQTKKCTLGDFIQSVKVGKITHETLAGTVKLQAGANYVEVGMGSVDAVAMAGPATLKALAGGATVMGSTSVTVTSAGTVTITGAGGISLMAAGSGLGPVVNGSDIDPIIGQPLSSPLCGLMGATGVRINS
jgi:hypothetical protein